MGRKKSSKAADTKVKTKSEAQRRQADDDLRKSLPPGVKLVRTLRGHTNRISRIAWSPDGHLLASPSADKTIRIWDAASGDCLHVLKGHKEEVIVVAFDSSSNTLASGGGREWGRHKDTSLRIWNCTTGALLSTFGDHNGAVSALTFDHTGDTLISASHGGDGKIWELKTGKMLSMLPTNSDTIYGLSFDETSQRIAVGRESGLSIFDKNNLKNSVVLEGTHGWATNSAFAPDGQMLATGGDDRTVKIWDASTYKSLLTLEGHTDATVCLSFSADSKILASKGRGSDSTIRIWDPSTGRCLAVIPEFTSIFYLPGLAFHPQSHLLAAVGSDPGTPERNLDDPLGVEIIGNVRSAENPYTTERDQVIHIYELDLDFLLRQPLKPAVSYTSAKVILVGDSGVGKTGLGWRLAHGGFKEHASTHGQQFWLLEQLCKKRSDGTECEAVLWDLAGQPDYRLIHALFLDDADLALVLFDPTRNEDPLSGVEFWLKQLKAGQQKSVGPPILLIAARCDRGTPRLTQEDLEAFCDQRGITAYLPTSAMAGDGIEVLVEQMKCLIPWDSKPATVTTETFKRIKNYVLELKENRRRRKVILTPGELRERLEESRRKWRFTEAEMLTAVGHLANHGYVTRLKTSQGDARLLLTPELLNNLAASFVLEARRHVKGLGSLEEQKLLVGGYVFPELGKVSKDEKAILIDSAAGLFLEHNVCFRETDLLGNAYLVFPELINLKRPLEEGGQPVEDGVAYTVSGAVENVYASLVVMMGYTQTFTRTSQWKNHARYEVGRGQVCGFRLETERAGELDFVLYFAVITPVAVRMLFQSLFENFLNRRNLTVHRFEPVACNNGHVFNRAVVRQRSVAGADFAFCSECGEKTTLPNADQPIQLTKEQADEVEADRRAADERSRFEQVLFRLKTYATDQKLASPECFISYAWGIIEHELWVERRLATDLQKAGVGVVLDRWENSRIGASVPRFVERAGKCDRVIVVGTPLYRTKYENNEPMRGFVVAAEGDLIGKRMIGTEAKKESVLPVLLDGKEDTAFPHLLHGRVYADFRKPEAYFATLLDLLLTLFDIKPQDRVAIDIKTFL